MNDNKNYLIGGTGFTELLQIVFIVLRLCRIINWSWWLVLLPFEISVVIWIIQLILLLIITAIRNRGDF